MIYPTQKDTVMHGAAYKKEYSIPVDSLVHIQPYKLVAAIMTVWEKEDIPLTDVLDRIYHMTSGQLVQFIADNYCTRASG